MAKENPGFEVVGGTEIEKPSSEANNAVAIAMLQIGLKALSQKALTAISDLFTLLTVGSAFWLWWSIPTPNYNQIVSLALYGLLILAINVIVRRK